VAEQLLDGADVVAVFEEVSGEGVAKGVRCRGLGDSGGPCGRGNGPLDGGLVQVVATRLAGLDVVVRSGDGEQPLPGPFAWCGGVLPAESVGQLDGAVGSTAGAVSIVLGTSADEVLLQGSDEDGGKDGVAIFSPLSVPHNQLTSFQVGVLHPQLQAFEQAKPSAIRRAATSR